MEIREFSEIIRVELVERTGLEVKTQEVRKNNNVVLHGLCISEPGSNLMPTIYLDSFYEAYEDGMSAEAIVKRIISIHQKEKPSISFDTSWFTDWERVKGKICFRLINYGDNKELLEDIPHTKYLDLAKVYFVVVEDSEVGSGSILIHNSHLGFWGVTAEQLEEIAAENTPKQFPIQFNNMWDTLEELKPSDCDLSELDSSEWIMYVVSNTKKINGAAVLCYPDAIGEFAEQRGSDFYILPSSIHEILLLPATDDSDSDYLKQMVREVNQTMVAAEEILSDSVYYYSRETKAITIA